MPSNNQLRQPNPKSPDHEESSLLTSSAAHRQSLNTTQPSQSLLTLNLEQRRCSWSLYFGILFCVLFALIIYRYAISQYPNDKPKNRSENLQDLGPMDEVTSPKPKDQTNEQTEKNQQNNQQQQNPHLQDPFFIDTIAIETSRQGQFSTPYTIWLFPKHSSPDYSNNIHHYSSPQSSKIQRVTTQNYRQLIQSKPVLRALDLLRVFELSQDKLQAFLQHLVMFTLLEENGGLIIGGDLVLTEGLDERRVMKRVEEVRHSFGMFLYTGQDSQRDLNTVQIDFQNYLIASGKHFWLLKQLIPRMATALEQELAEFFPSPQNLLSRYNSQLQQIMSLRFQQYESVQPISQVKLPFLQHLKIFSLGSTQSLNLVQPYLMNLSLPSNFQYLATLSQQALEQFIGPVNPIVHLPLSSYAQFVTQLTSSPEHPVFLDSFLYSRMLSFSNQYPNIKPLSSQTNHQKYAPWKIPKILWTFINKMNEKSPLHDHFVSNLIFRAHEAQFELIVLTEETMQAFLDGRELHEIFSNFKNDQTESQHEENERKFSQLLKWYILKNYGGVFVEFGYFLLQNMNWVSKIKSNEHIFNNVHKDPEILMFHNHSSVKEWSVNNNSDIKIIHNLTYLTTGFVAAVRNSSFIANQITNLLKNFQEQSADEHPKQQLPQQTSKNQSYKIWSLSSLLGGQKMDLVIQGQQFKCFHFKDSLSQFKLKYGSLGYVSELVTNVSAQQLKEKVPLLNEDSIFGPFFIGKNINRKEIQKFKSLKEVSLAAQKIKI